MHLLKVYIRSATILLPH